MTEPKVFARRLFGALFVVSILMFLMSVTVHLVWLFELKPRATELGVAYTALVLKTLASVAFFAAWIGIYRYARLALSAEDPVPALQRCALLLCFAFACDATGGIAGRVVKSTGQDVSSTIHIGAAAQGEDTVVISDDMPFVFPVTKGTMSLLVAGLIFLYAQSLRRTRELEDEFESVV